MLLGVCSLHSSTGVTSLAVALAGAWPGEDRPIVLEANRLGGDLQRQHGLAEKPGLVTFAGLLETAMRHRPQARPPVHSHLQLLPGGVPVLVAPTTGVGIGSAINRLTAWRSPRAGDYGWLSNVAKDPQKVVIADLGVITPSAVGFSAGVADHAGLLLVVARPILADVDRLVHNEQELHLNGAKVGIVLRGPGFSASEVAQSVPKIPVVAELPEVPFHGLGDLVRGTRVRRRYSVAVERLAAWSAEHLAPYSWPELDEIEIEDWEQEQAEREAKIQQRVHGGLSA